MSKNALMQKIADDLCAKFPTISTRALSKILQKKAGVTHENAYSAIRRRRGLKKTGHGKLASKIYPHIPVSIAKDYTPFKITGKSIGILSDVHVPYHNTKAIDVAVKYLGGMKCDTILLNGDIWDCYMLSDFDRDPRSADSVERELEKVDEFIGFIHGEFPKAKIIYREGNHEYRLQRYLMANAAELLGVRGFTLPEMLDFSSRGIDWVSEKRIIHAGMLSILHGHELASGISAPVNPARGLFLKFKDCAMMGHSHQTSEHTEKTGNNKIVTCWSVGCLADLHPMYRPINNYNHGCAHVSIYGDGQFHVENKRIINGRLV